MRRRRTTLVSIAAAGLALSACGTFSDNDVVAKVEGAEFTEDDLREIYGDIDAVPADLAREQALTFVLGELLAADLAALGVDAPDTDFGDMAAGDAMLLRFQTLAGTWTRLSPSVLLDEAALAVYAQGGEASGIVCPAHILVATSEEADAVVAELEGGADFASLAAELSLDGSGAQGGLLSCYPPEAIDQVFVPEFADAVNSADIGVPTAPVESAFGFHIIRLLPADDLPSGAAARVRLQTFEDRYDIYVDPRFGEWSPDGTLVPVG